MERCNRSQAQIRALGAKGTSTIACRAKSPFQSPTLPYPPEFLTLWTCPPGLVGALMQVSESPESSCSEKDPEADEATRTLFPPQPER